MVTNTQTHSHALARTCTHKYTLPHTHSHLHSAQARAWEFMRVRTDKTTANHISVFDKVVASIIDDLQVCGCVCDGGDATMTVQALIVTLGLLERISFICLCQTQGNALSKLLRPPPPVPLPPPRRRPTCWRPLTTPTGSAPRCTPKTSRHSRWAGGRAGETNSRGN